MSAVTPVNVNEIVRTDTAMFVLTSIVLLARAALHIWQRKPFELPDFFVYFAYLFYVALWSCFIAVTKPMFRLYAVARGDMKPYATFVDDADTVLKLLTAGQICFYTVLFSIKMSLLTFYDKLLVGVSGVYRKIWWSIVTFCVVGFLGSIFTAVFTCNDLHAKYTQGACSGTADEYQRILLSLWFAYSFDVTTDFAIMALPIRLTWNLQLPKLQKSGILVLFGSGIVCIIFSTLRAVQLGVDGKVKDNVTIENPQYPKFVPLWTILECTIAVMIGCGPAFAVLVRKRLNNSKKSSHNAQGYQKQRDEEIRMRSLVTIGNSSKQTGRDRSDTYWNDTHSSQEELAKNAGRIVVKTTLRQDNERLSEISRTV